MSIKLATYITIPWFFFFSSRRRHTRCSRDWSSDVCSSDLSLQRGRELLVEHDLPGLQRAAQGAKGLNVLEVVRRDGEDRSRTGPDSANRGRVLGRCERSRR